MERVLSRIIACVMFVALGFVGGYFVSMKLCPTPPVATEVVAQAHASEQKDVCQLQYGVPCSVMPHDVGPSTAEEEGRSRACSNGVFVDRHAGRWVVAKNSRNESTGEAIATGCVATSP